jgi:hypothetical protein
MYQMFCKKMCSYRFYLRIIIIIDEIYLTQITYACDGNLVKLLGEQGEQG